MKEAFIEHKFEADSQEIVTKANGVIEGYLRQGYRLSLRQLYYQFVTRNWIVNTERSYKRLGSIINNGRLAGVIDWDAIEDRIRVPKVPNEFHNLKHLVETALAAYRLPRWDGQDNYVELWVEKDALAGVLEPLARDYHVTLMVNKGYSSQSAMYEAARRFADQEGDRHLLYLGDHDPSGEDMVRDVRDRLERFGVDVTVTKVALTMDQVREFALPPNPAKKKDSRASGYIAIHGAQSWEVDALPPDVLHTLVRESIEALLDADLMDAQKQREQKDKSKLLAAASRIVRVA